MKTTNYFRMLNKNNKLENVRLNANKIDCLFSQVVKIDNKRFMIHSGNYDNKIIFYTWCDSMTLYSTSLNSLKRKILQFGLNPFDMV